MVEMPEVNGNPAQRFKLGTGFSDTDRQRPPAVGCLVTYRFRGLNDNGVPRFASFVQVREEALNQGCLHRLSVGREGTVYFFTQSA